MLFNREPVLIMGLIRAFVLLVTAFGLRLEAPQIAAIMVFTEAALSAVTRQRVSPTATTAVPAVIVGAAQVTGA